MKSFLLTLLTGLCYYPVFGQPIISGDYEAGLRLAYNKVSKQIISYFESYTGLDETTGQPQFSCIFYLEGVITGKKAVFKTYYPAKKKDNLIPATLEILNNRHIRIKLPKEHGGCWNVQHFADAPVGLEPEKAGNGLSTTLLLPHD